MLERKSHAKGLGEELTEGLHRRKHMDMFTDSGQNFKLQLGGQVLYIITSSSMNTLVGRGA